MKANVTCEIRVALIGYVSVGKTTVLNALFGDRYGEVSMQRTTAVVNNFRISTTDQGLEQEGIETRPDEAKSAPREEKDEEPSLASPKVTKEQDTKTTPASIHAESVADNLAHRNSPTVITKTYDVTLDEAIHPMRPDTQLVIVDIPGINEAGTDDKYRNYVIEHWHSFDVAAVVLDGTQGVNTMEQMDLLRMINELQTSEKKMPIIFISNKNDDPDDDEQRLLFKEFKFMVRNIFGGCNTIKNAFHDDSTLNDYTFQSDFPIAIPFSARTAFLYRCGARLTFEAFCALDSKLINRLGKETYGRIWRSFADADKLSKAYEAIHNPTLRHEALAETSFDALQDALALSIGDDAHQTQLIRHHVSTVLEKQVEDGKGDLVGEIKNAVKLLQSMHCDISHLPDIFWKGFAKMEKQVWFSSLVSKRSSVEFSQPMEQLVSFYSLAKEVGWRDEYKQIALRAKDLVFKQVGLFLDRNDADHSLLETQNTNRARDQSQETSSTDSTSTQPFGSAQHTGSLFSNARSPSFPVSTQTPATGPKFGTSSGFAFGATSDQTFAASSAPVLGTKYGASPRVDDLPLTKKDLSLIFGSMLLFLNTPTASFHFGKIKLELDARYTESLSWFSPGETPICDTPNCANTGEMSPFGSSFFCNRCATYFCHEFPTKCPCSCGTKWDAAAARSCLRLLRSVNVKLIKNMKKIPSGFVDQKFEGRDLVPVHESTYKHYVTVEVPDSPEYPTHFGHVIWKCCSILEEIENGDH